MRGLLVREQIRVLFFDVYGTVVDWRGPLLDRLADLGARRGAVVDAPAFVDDWKAGYRPGMDAVNAGERPWATVRGLLRERLEALLPAHGLADLDPGERDELTRGWCASRPWPDAAPALARLRRRYTLCTLSNGDVACLVAMARAGGLPWDCVLCAEIFRRYKPAEEVYTGALALLDVAPAQAMLVAAHNYDLRAARALGLRTAFVRRPLEHGPGQRTDLAAEEDWDLTGEDLGGVADALGV
jgi:2-haloacid dehalogenase